MSLEVGHSYKLVIEINSNILTYTCTIIDIDDIFVSFLDKFGKEYSYNKKLIISYEEVKV